MNILRHPIALILCTSVMLISSFLFVSTTYGYDEEFGDTVSPPPVNTYNSIMGGSGGGAEDVEDEPPSTSNYNSIMGGSGGGAESTPPPTPSNYNSIMGGTGGGAEDVEDNSHSNNHRTSVRGGKDFNTSNGHSNSNNENSDITPQDTDQPGTGEHTNRQTRPERTGFFSKIFGGISDFFRGIFKGDKNNNDRTPTGFPTTNTESDKKDTDTNKQNVDLIPETTRVNVAQEYTTFLGQIKLASGGDVSKKDSSVTCSDNDISYAEGTSRQSLTNSDGTTRFIADASFVCRGGAWKTEGSYPAQNPGPHTEGINTTNTEPDSDTFFSGTSGDVRGLWTSRPQGSDGPTRAPDSDTPYVIGSSPENTDVTPSWHAQPSDITNTLLIDYACDGSVDVEKDFTAPYKTIRSGSHSIIPLSVRVETGSEGNHCFAFKIDTRNVVQETDETNNQTPWHSFEVQSTIIPVAPGQHCPAYQQPRCATDEKLIPGTQGTDGCVSAPQCVSTSVTSPENVNLKVKVYSQSSVTGGVPIYTVRDDWTSQDVTVNATDKLQFSWEAHAHSQCLTYLHPVKYDFSGQITQNVGNTEELNQELRTLSDIYAVECSNGDTTYRQEIRVTVE